jgi:hypothetical protein
MTQTGEVTHDIYYQKYLKYKAKYLELKKQLGSGKSCPRSYCYIDNDRMRTARAHRFVRGVCSVCNCVDR